MKRAFMLGAAALVASCVFAQDVFAQRSGSRGLGEAGSAPLLPDILAVRNYAWSYARACGVPAGLDYVITRALISRTCQLELPHSFLRVMQERSTACWAWDGYQ